MGKLTLLFLSMFNTHCASPVEKKFIQDKILTLAAKIPLQNVRGRIDHIALDPARHLAFIAALGNNTVEVVNTRTNQVVHTIKYVHEPQGIIFIASSQRLVVANGGDGSCVFYDTENYTVLKIVSLKEDADNIRYDAGSGLLYVGYGNGAIAVINATEMNLITSIPLDGHPESFQLSKKQNRIFINIPGVDEIEVAELSSHTIVAKWKNTNAASNFPMALDDNNDRLFVGCRNPATLRMINSKTGKDIQFIKCSGDVDDVFYDEQDSLVIVSAGEGFIDVFKATKTLEKVTRIETRSGSRTSLLIPSEKKLLVAVPAHNGNIAALWIYTINKS